MAIASHQPLIEESSPITSGLLKATATLPFTRRVGTKGVRKKRDEQDIWGSLILEGLWYKGGGRMKKFSPRYELVAEGAIWVLMGLESVTRRT